MEQEYVNPQDLTDIWVAGKEISYLRIFEYLCANLGALEHHSESDVNHVASLLADLQSWSVGKLPYVGDFLTAVAENNLDRAVMFADETNKRLLWLYPMFLYNVAPSTWKRRLTEETA